MLRKSTEEDLMLLTEFSKNAFNSDSSVGGQENDGPPGYDSYNWHKNMLQQSHLFTYINDREIAGGAALFKNGSTLVVGRIFISPDFFKQGLGLSLMQDIEGYFPDLKKVRLDTPIWNVRTNNFYLKCGYSETKRDAETVHYEKILEG